MSQEVTDRVFEPFFTTKPRGEGTGLGLPTARRIAEMHGGSVEVVESSPAGTTFRVRLRSRAVVGMAGWTGHDS
jgi:signal transduction histidine kinase